MSAILRLFGLEPPDAVKAAQHRSREAFDAQIRERSVTKASREVQVAMGRMRRALDEAIEETSKPRNGHAD